MKQPLKWLEEEQKLSFVVEMLAEQKKLSKTSRNKHRGINLIFETERGLRKKYFPLELPATPHLPSPRSPGGIPALGPAGTQAEAAE